MQNLTATTRWPDFVAGEPKIRAKDSLGNYVGTEWIGTFLDSEGLGFLCNALKAGNIDFEYQVEETFTFDVWELRKPYIFTILKEECRYTFEAKQILGILLAGVPVHLTFRAGQFGFTPDPVAPPVPRPNPGQTSGSDLIGTLPAGADIGAFTAADRAMLKEILRLLSTLKT